MKKEDALPEITVCAITENEDGTAYIEADLDAAAVKLLLNVGFNKILVDHLEEQERKENDNTEV